MDIKENDSKLFTPGPLTTSLTVKEAMLHDLGSRDTIFLNIIAHIRGKLLELADVSADEHAAVLVQGSGTYAVEATFSTTVPHQGANVLIIENGAYGQRMIKICRILNIPHDVISFHETVRVQVDLVANKLQSNHYTHVAIIHCETSSGVLNPIEEIGQLVYDHGTTKGSTVYIVDSMSAFGAVPVSLRNGHITYIISSANKCIEGVPGFAFVIGKKQHLLTCQGQARSLVLDLYDQYTYMEQSKQFRFTPPTHTILAFKRALDELDQEGGVQGRAKRYQANNKLIREKMRTLGFIELIKPEYQTYIITSYYYPSAPFNFQTFYNKLSEKHQLIYPGKTTETDCFRIGNIGRLFENDMATLAECIKEVCEEMNIELPLKNNTKQ
ncbi:unnamed protein product [Rotaria socialis]|uniref:Alanine--glyoxylate aminotransferase n=1 Tax=Rotaria socialis TaxID=392032 RepID=A0A820TTH7_9BILA|nr:unnamed protein product [Rotaria socialis]CAF3404877.1 unnamed protein product [Rotaria socialis]CAF3501316.1 unnamed protein product [Rotaria socialis]CAF3710509.1 unnamed protein product [Rotaria socialis]CAF4238124.1 unnamed protein product [Rotaria socialis]